MCFYMYVIASVWNKNAQHIAGILPLYSLSIQVTILFTPGTQCVFPLKLRSFKIFNKDLVARVATKIFELTFKMKVMCQPLKRCEAWYTFPWLQGCAKALCILRYAFVLGSLSFFLKGMRDVLLGDGITK